jgi:hypothetical protein
MFATADWLADSLADYEQVAALSRLSQQLPRRRRPTHHPAFPICISSTFEGSSVSVVSLSAT